MGKLPITSGLLRLVERISPELCAEASRSQRNAKSHKRREGLGGMEEGEEKWLDETLIGWIEARILTA